MVDRRDNLLNNDTGSDAERQLYRDLYNINLFHVCGRYGNSDAAAGAESTGFINQRNGGHAGEPFGDRLCGHADLVNGPERQHYQRNANECVEHLLGHLYDGPWLYDDCDGDGEHSACGELSCCIGDGVLRQLSDADGFGL